MSFSPFESLADALTGLFGLDTSSGFGAATNYFIYELFKVGFLIAAISFFMGIVRASLPMESIRGWLAKPGRRALGYPAAALFGAVTPFCSCSSVPLFIGFVEAGIPLGITFSFLITSPLINEVVVALFLADFGWEITVLYVVAGLILGISGGLAMQLLKVEELLTPFAKSLRTPKKQPEPKSAGCGCASGGCCGPKPKSGPGWPERLRFGMTESRDITLQVLPYLCVALLLGAAIHGFVPENHLARYFSGGEWWSVPAATLAGLPLYASANGTVPVLQTLIQKGMPFGTAMAFILAAVGVSLPELIILKRVMTVRLLALFTLIFAVGVILVGYLFNTLHFVPTAHP
jgi:uncharacterized membrane protein YraQ (UPF0718 family)